MKIFLNLCVLSTKTKKFLDMNTYFKCSNCSNNRPPCFLLRQRFRSPSASSKLHPLGTVAHTGSFS